MKDHSSYDYSSYSGVRGHGAIIASEHIVEDARSKPRERDSSVSPGKKKASYSKGKTIILTAMITLFAFSLTLIAADLIGSGGGIALYTNLFHKKNKTHSVSYYAVYATHSADMSISYKNATVIREEGGAGYVMKESEEYYVILNLYDTIDKAKNVTERKANYGILEIKIPDFNVKKQPLLASAESSKDLYKEAYLTLYNAANNLASGKYQKEDMRRVLLAYKERVIAEETSYSQRIGGTEDTCSIEYKVILAEIRSAFENLEKSDDHLVSDARYYSVMIVRSYALFAEKYFG